MKNLKKIGALLMAVVMMMALSVTAFAADFTNGEAGVWTQQDKEIIQEKNINIKKEIIAYNPNGTTVNAPSFTYIYTVTPAVITVGTTTVTDAADDHVSGKAVTAPVKAGSTAGLVVTGSAKGTAGSAESAIGTLVFTNDSEWITAANGEKNTYDINLDFSGVSFSQPGVYRYKITETISAKSYDAIAMEDGTTNNIYLDVYVDGEFAIYGYVCMAAKSSVTPETLKLNGFVSGSDSDGSDKYYTYDLTLSKTVENDAYAKSAIAFPFTVIFSNTEDYTSTFTIKENVADGSKGISPAAASAPTWNGVAMVKDSAPITFTGIPAGVDVEVYETNIANGVTYAVATSVDNGKNVTDAAVVWGETPAGAVAQGDKKADCQSTKAVIDTNKIEKTLKQSVSITNTLLLISPTGVALRVAPFVLMMAAGAVLLLFARRFRRAEAEG